MDDKKNWPSWRYGPNGAADVFDSAAEVPAGWQDHPSKVGEKPATAAKPPLEPGTAADLDAAGWPFDATLHAATQTKTKDSLWRMKVGVKRPAPKPGFPKPVLDL